MADFWEGVKRFFGITTKRPDIPETPKIKPSLTDFPVGAELNKRILAALRGEMPLGPAELGFGPGFVSRTTSPLVAQRQARFAEEEVPFIKGELGAAGLARSVERGGTPLGVGVLAKAAREKERDINVIIANAELMNEQQKKTDELNRLQEKARYEQLAQGFVNAETTQQMASVQDELERVRTNLEIDLQRQATEREDLNRLIGTALAVGGGFFPPLAPAAGIFGATTGGGDITSLLRELLQEKKRREFTSPFISRGGRGRIDMTELALAPSTPSF